MKIYHKYLSLFAGLYGCHVIIMITFLMMSQTAMAGPNALSGCALDMDYSTHDYDIFISEKDIESQITARASDDITIAVVAQNVSDLDTFQVEVNYDSSLIAFIQGVKSDNNIDPFLSQHGGNAVGFQAVERQAGTVNIACALTGQDKEQAPEGSGIIALLHFKILNDQHIIHLSLSNVNFLNADFIKDSIINTMDAIISKPYYVKLNAGNGGYTEPSGMVTVPYGDSVTVNIMPDDCHDIANVKINGISRGQLTAHTFEQITRNHYMSVSFSPMIEDLAYNLPDCWKSQYPGIGDDSEDYDRDGYSNYDEFLNHTNPTVIDLPGVYEGYRSSSDDNENLPYHILSTRPTNPRASVGEYFSIDILYKSSENESIDNIDTNFLIHYDSSLISLVNISNQLTGITILEKEGIETPDLSDDDIFTDKVINLRLLTETIHFPARLCTLTYSISTETQENDILGETSMIRFTDISDQQDYIFHGTPATLEIDDFNLDIDADGRIDALSDGLLVMRFLFGLIDQHSDSTITNIVSQSAMRKRSKDIWNYINKGKSKYLDIDGDGQVDSLTDGLLLLRYLFCINKDPSLTQNAISENATRITDTEIVKYIKQYVFN